MVQDDWSAQLRKIEREFEGLPPEPSPAFKKLQSEEERRAQERGRQRVALFGVTARLLLVGAVAAALAFWPYPNDCGPGLAGFLATEAVIVVGGLWVAITTWRARLPRMHVLSLLITLGGLTLITAEVLPRVGYAAVDAKNPPRFSCPGTPAPATASTSPASAGMTESSLATGAVAEQRVQATARELQSRWQSRVSELSKRFQPRKDALVQLERPELLSRRGP